MAGSAPGEPLLAGKTALVTGAASGMGAVMARALAEAGASVAGIDLDAAGLRQREAEIAQTAGSKGFFSLVADVASTESAEAAVKQVIARLGGFDILVNCAGVAMRFAVPSGRTGGTVPFWQADPDGWQKVMAINSTGTFLMARFAVPQMVARGWGRVINVTTSFDTMLREGFCAYGASKASVEASTAIWAKDLAGTGVTVNILVPGGPTDTPFLPPDTRSLPGLLKPEVMVKPVRWLASTQSDGITGYRFIARDWDATLPPDQAAERARAPAAWPNLAESASAQRG